MSFRSPFQDVEIPEQSLFDYLFADLAAADLDRVALVDGATGATTTYGTLRDGIERFAGALAARGLAVGDVVGVLLPNLPAFAVVYHGILRAGGTATTLNVLYTDEDITKQLTDCRAVALVTVSPLLPQAEKAAAAVGIPADRLVVIDGVDGHPSLGSLLGEGAAAPDVSFDPATHVAALPYSSGTTGKPKGVMLSHRNLVANVAQIRPRIGFGSDDRVLALLPFFHIYGMTVLLNATLRQRATLVTMVRFDLREFLRIIAERRITFVFIAPPIAVALAKHPMVDQFDLSSVRAMVSGAASLDAALGKAVETRLGCRVVQGYGMTELSPVSHSTPIDDESVSLDSVGPAISNVESKLVAADTGAEVPLPTEGESAPGELCVRGPNVMLGYLNNPEATAEIIDSDGFLHTGDLATVNPRGHVTVVDRLKELIKYKGYQVPPAELEALLLTHPSIADAAVVGVPDAEGEEIPKAFVVRVAGAELSDQDVMDFVAEHVAPYKKVRAVSFVESVPKSAAGKILRKDLRAGA